MSEPRVIDPRLLGTWKSDKARTLEEWAYAAATTSDEQDRIANWFGKLAMRYTAARVFTNLEGEATQCPYRVVAKDPESVAIVCRTEGRDEIRHIHFIGDNLYWVSVGRNREFFARVVDLGRQGKGSRASSANEA